MSYILDALKKSEAERNRGSLPTLLTIPDAGLLKSHAAIWAVLGALIINAALVAMWLYRPTQTESPQPTVSVAAAPAAAPAPIARPDAQPSIPAPVVDTADIENAVRPSNPAPAPGQFAFSTHVYADDPTLRAVTLQGRRFIEGDMISAGVQLKEITETGVVLDIDGRNVAMEVLQDWR